MPALIILGIILIYTTYWVGKSLIDRVYAEAFLGMGAGILSAQIFIVANYAGQFLSVKMDKNLTVALQIIGLFLLFLSIIFIIAAYLSRRKMSNLTSFWGSTQIFIAQGIYGIVRHPIQLAGILAALGIPLMMANIVILILGLIACASFIISAREEDEHSKEAIGYDYEIYMSDVSAFNFVKGIVGTVKDKR